MRIFITALLLFALTRTNAQSALGIGIGTGLGALNFTSETGATDEQLKVRVPAAVAIIYLMPLKIGQQSKANPLSSCLQIEGAYLPYRATDINANVLTSWNLNYVGLKATYRYMYALKGSFHPIAEAGITGQYLLLATQQRGIEYYNIYKDLNPINLTAHLAAGVNYSISEKSFCTLTLAYDYGIANLEKQVNQVAKLHAAQLKVALFFNLK